MSNQPLATKTTGANVTMVYGYVAKNGDIESGSGDFTVAKDSHDGIYKITFNLKFQAKPAIVVTAAVTESDPTDLSNGQIATVNNDTAGGFQLIIKGSGGSSHNHDFSFIACGV